MVAYRLGKNYGSLHSLDLLSNQELLHAQQWDLVLWSQLLRLKLKTKGKHFSISTVDGLGYNL